jgi:HrpA-like RNA helicase
LGFVDESLINYELLERLLCHIVSKQQGQLSDANAILVFLPGAPEISRLTRALQVLLPDSPHLKHLKLCLWDPVHWLCRHADYSLKDIVRTDLSHVFQTSGLLTLS